MGIEIRYQTVNGVVTPYWVPVFDPVGADGLVGADARILELPYMDVDGVQTPYWVPDTNGDKYTDDFPGGGGQPQEPTGYVAKYTSYLVDNFTLVTGDSVNVWADEVTKTYGSEEVTNGDFSGGDTDWNYDPAYTDISGGKCSWNGTASANLSQTAVVDIGTEYIITFDVSDMTTGLLLFRNPSSTTSLSVSANGSYSHIYSALDNDVTFRGSSGFDGSIDNISVKEVLTGANDLTQATSSNQPKLVEDFTATQFTASNQPTLIDDAGTWKLDFDSNDFMNGLKPQTSDFTYVFTGLDIPTYTTSTDVLLSNGDATNLERILNVTGSIQINDRLNTVVFLEPWNNEDTIVVRLSGNTLSVFAGGIQIGSDTNVTGSVFDNIYRIGKTTTNSLNGSLQSLEIYDVAVADVTNITETPVQTLTADPLKMRTSANLNPTDGQDVAKWYADEFSAYRDARVVFDADDYMEGLPALTGDWSYMIDTSINTLGTTKYLLEQTAGSSAILALADNYMYLRDTTGANDIALTSYTLTTGRTQFGFVRSGDDLLYYVNGVLKETVDVTGRTFNFGTVGKNATSADMDTKQIIPFDRALTQKEIDYYSYLRSETGEILLPPLLPSVPTVYDVNSATLDGSTQYFDAGNSNDLDVSSSFTLNIWVHPTVLNTSNGIFSKWNTSSGDWSFISAIINGKPYISFSTTGSDNNELTGATDIVVDQMYMITATYDGSTLKLYANGVEDANSLSVTGNVYISSESLRIGSVRDNNIGSILYFTGSLAMPMIYNRALTSTEITALYNEGTVPCYADIDTSITDDCVYAPPLYNGADVSVGQELTDQSTSGITTTAVGSPTYTDQGLQVECTPSDTTVYPLSAMNTTGAGSVYTNDSSFNLTALKASGFSMSLFCSTTTNTFLGYLMNLRGDGTSAIPQEVALKVQAGNYITLECYNGSGFNTFQTTVKLHTNGLTHIGVSIGAGGSSLSLYINGSEVSSGTVTNLATDSASALSIGEGQQGNLYSPTDGLKAMPRVTNREITPAEMLYFAENPSVCYDSIDNTNGLRDATIYAPTLGEYNGSVNQALIDPASGITTNETGTVTYNGTGVSVECDT